MTIGPELPVFLIRAFLSLTRRVAAGKFGIAGNNLYDITALNGLASLEQKISATADPWSSDTVWP